MKPTNDYFAHILVVAGAAVMLGLIYFAFNMANNKNERIAQAIKYAIDKGVDPMSVKCAYTDDLAPLCVIYLSKDKDDVSSAIIKK